MITRRGFIAGLGAATAGLALGFGGVGGVGVGVGVAEAAPAAPKLFAPSAFIQIGTDGQVTIVCARSEMGQGIRSSLPVLIADELGADPGRIHIVQADGDFTRYGDQNTDGSTSVRNFYDAMRGVAATARAMLVAAAAQRWHVPAATLVAHDDAVHDPARTRALSFGELATAAAALPVPKTAPLRPVSELVHVGTKLPLVDAAAYVTGRAAYGADISLPGMLVAAIARPPAVLDTVAAFDATRAKQVHGVRAVVQLPAPKPPVGFQPLGGVAVIADHTWAALRGRAALDVTWTDGPNAGYDSAAYNEQLLAAVRAPGEVVRHVGDTEAALASAARTLDAEYLVPHLVHAPMEPMAAIARLDAQGHCEVWAPTQSPADARGEVAKALGISIDDVTVHVTFLGGGFGRKSKPDFIVEAALLAREMKAPVRVQWTRDDEIKHAYYHTVSAQKLSAGLDANGDVVAWRHRIAYPSISSTFKTGVVRPSGGELGQGVTDLPLAVPNVRVETGEAPAHARIGWMRSVCNVQQAFAVQSFIHELAVATKRDHRDMLMRVLGPARIVDEAAQGVPLLSNYGASLAQHPIDVGRLHNVIERVTASAGWGKGTRALGLAAHRSFLTYVACVASASRGPDGEPRIDEAWICVDAGTVINLDRVHAQMEGGFVFAMSSALHGAITMKRGATQQRNFRDYPIARIGEVPRMIHVDVVPSTRPPGGVGEPGVPAIAPAIANALYALDGVRRRELPLVKTPA